MLTALTFSPIAFSQTILCPPSSAIHCTKGICIVDEPYSKNWRLYVTRYPNNANFWGAYIQNPPNTAVCTYGGTRRDFLTLNSDIPYSPDKSVPGNKWLQKSNGFDGCNSGSVEECPLK
jgi:hypothetical protein